MKLTTSIKSSIESILRDHISTDAIVVSIEQQEGNQGYSGAEISYFDVSYTLNGTHNKIALVTKKATLVERKTLVRLGQQGLAVPFSYSPDLTTNEPALIYMQFAGDVLEKEQPPAQVAQALAAVHHANLNKFEELDWLPLADEEYIEQWIVQNCWRTAWESLMAGGPFIDGYGQTLGLPGPGADFRTEFSAYTKTIEAIAENMRTAVKQLWLEGDSLTLIHADFHNNHVHSDGERPYIIDWGAVRYGPLYLDLPNYFSREEALVYRQALETLGHPIPEDIFLAYYDAVRPYPGFKYFGIGLYNWCFGNPPHQAEHVHHFIDMILK